MRELGGEDIEIIRGGCDNEITGKTKTKNINFSIAPDTNNDNNDTDYSFIWKTFLTCFAIGIGVYLYKKYQTNKLIKHNKMEINLDAQICLYEQLHNMQGNGLKLAEMDRSKVKKELDAIKGLNKTTDDKIRQEAFVKLIKIRIYHDFKIVSVEGISKALHEFDAEQRLMGIRSVRPVAQNIRRVSDIAFRYLEREATEEEIERNQAASKIQKWFKKIRNKNMSSESLARFIVNLHGDPTGLFKKLTGRLAIAPSGGYVAVLHDKIENSAEFKRNIVAPLDRKGTTMEMGLAITPEILALIP